MRSKNRKMFYITELTLLTEFVFDLCDQFHKQEKVRPKITVEAAVMLHLQTVVKL